MGATASRLQELFKQAKSWPESYQEELVEMARDIEARRNRLYRATPEAIDDALAQVARGEVVGMEEMGPAFAKFRSA
jgi:hypothetical protein